MPRSMSWPNCITNAYHVPCQITYRSNVQKTAFSVLLCAQSCSFTIIYMCIAYALHGLHGPLDAIRRAASTSHWDSYASSFHWQRISILGHTVDLMLNIFNSSIHCSSGSSWIIHIHNNDTLLGTSEVVGSNDTRTPAAQKVVGSGPHGPPPPL